MIPHSTPGGNALPNNDQIDNTCQLVSSSPIYGLHLSRLSSKKSLPTNSIQAIDILPSYQMHQSILNRPNDNARVASDNGTNEFQDVWTSELPSYALRNPVPDDDTSVVDQRINSDISKDSILDNINLLPTVIDKNIKITIKVEKPVQPFFSNGDTIIGTVEIENLSKQKTPFELFFVSFEANSRVAASDDSFHDVDYRMRSFLRMIDLGASWTESDTAIKLSDNLYLNLPRDKILLPQTTYQKFFTFKIPKDALDASCAQNISTHSHLPPSIGMNSILFPPKGLEYNDEERKTFKVKDFSSMVFSINYSIDVRLIKKSELTRTHIISSIARFLIRVIPCKNENHDDFVLPPEKSLVLLERIISNDIRHAINEETDPDQLKLQNLYSPIKTPQRLNYYLTGKFTNSFKLASKEVLKKPMSEKYTPPSMNLLTFSTNSMINLEFNKMSNAMITINNAYLVRFEIDIFYQIRQPDLYSIQQSYRSITKLDSIIPQEISAELHYVNVHAKGLPIPIELNPLWFTSKYIFQQKVRHKFKELGDKVDTLPENAQLYATTLQAIRAMKNLSYETGIIPNVIEAKLVGKKSTDLVENEFLEESYKTSLDIKLSIDNKKLKSILLVPDYQECFTSRFYFVRLKFKSTNQFNSKFSIHYNEFNGDVIDKISDKRYKFYLDIPLKIEKS